MSCHFQFLYVFMGYGLYICSVPCFSFSSWRIPITQITSLPSVFITFFSLLSLLQSCLFLVFLSYWLLNCLLCPLLKFEYILSWKPCNLFFEPGITCLFSFLISNNSSICFVCFCVVFFVVVVVFLNFYLKVIFHTLKYLLSIFNSVGKANYGFPWLHSYFPFFISLLFCSSSLWSLLRLIFLTLRYFTWFLV